MKRFTLLFMMISFFSGTSTAQIQVEPFHWDPYQNMSSSYSILKKSPCEVGQMLTFDKEFSVVKIPELSGHKIYSSENGPLIIVKFNSREYELGSLSGSNLEVKWIKSVTVLKDSWAETKYGCKGRNGVVIIELKKDHGAKIYKLEDGRIVEFSDRIKECEPPYTRKFVQ